MVVWKQLDPNPPADLRDQMLGKLRGVADVHGPQNYWIDDTLRRSLTTLTLTLDGVGRFGETQAGDAPRLLESARLDVMHDCLLPTWDKRSVRTITRMVAKLESKWTITRQSRRICTILCL